MAPLKSILFWASVVFPSALGFLLVPRTPLLELQSTQQKPLLPNEHHQIFRQGSFTKKLQDGTICKTRGENQWTGTVDVADDRRLFYWFFDSRSDPENDPIILWLNGGPGGSSMMGLFTELGPCLVTVDSSDTAPNPHSWNNNASVIFIDQPAGTGFSSVTPGSPYPDTDAKSAVDLAFFLSVFFEKVFPDRASLPIHFAGESYGGHYVPELTDHILQHRADNSPDAFTLDIRSIILVNALIETNAPAIGAWQLLCSDYRGHILNETACDKIAAAIPECEKLEQNCRMLNDKHACFGATIYCMEEVMTFYQSEIEAGRRSPYNIHLPCTNAPFCWDDTKGNYSTYLGQRHILTSLDFSPNFRFQAVNMDLNAGFERSKSEFQSNVYKVANILESGINVLVLNGNEDFIVNTPGQMLLYDSLPWSGQASYRASPWKPLGEEQGVWKQSKDGRLMFVGVDGAGHAAPGDQPEVIGNVVRQWTHFGRAM